MKLITNLLPAILFLLGSCTAPMNIVEIQNLEKIKFDSVQLRPEIEPNELRFDIIRQTHEESINDSTTEKKLNPYHPLGFYLGNGLFYDLNRNLSLRIDYLLNCSDSQRFEIKRFYQLNNDKSATIYKYNNNSFTVNYNPRKKDHEEYKKVISGDSIAFLYENRLSYAIVKSDTSILYRGEKRIWDIINQRDSSNFYIKHKSYTENYLLEGNRIKLDDDYIIVLNNDKNKIDIKINTKKGEVTLYTIIKDKNKMYIFNEKYYGHKIEFTNDGIIINWEDVFITKYEFY